MPAQTSTKQPFSKNIYQHWSGEHILRSIIDIAGLEASFLPKGFQ